MPASTNLPWIRNIRATGTQTMAVPTAGTMLPKIIRVPRKTGERRPTAQNRMEPMRPWMTPMTRMPFRVPLLTETNFSMRMRSYSSLSGDQRMSRWTMRGPST